MFDAFPKPPHLVRATVVVTMSDGHRQSWVVDGCDERTELVMSTEPEYDERRSAASLLTDYVATGYCDLTFRLNKVLSYTMYDQPAEPTGAEQPAIGQGSAAVEAARP